MSRSIRVLALSPVPEEGAGCRFRVSQFVPALEAAGFEVTIAPFFDVDFFRIIYQRGRHAAKLTAFIRRTAERLRMLATSGRYDLFFVYREAFPIGPPLIEWLLGAWRGRPIVYDFDDAIFLPNASEANRFASMLKYPQKVPALINRAAVVIAGNQFLADYARRRNRNVVIVPTSVDTRVFAPRPSSAGPDQPPLVGWIGTPTTAAYLESIAGPLAAVSKRTPFAFRLSGAVAPPALADLPIRAEPWSRDREVELFAGCDVGVYPLPDDEWARGKCGFKAIQFMACGVPVVASAVGVNCEIIEDGVNGFLASTEAEWVEKLGRLLAEPALRRRLAEAGRRTIEARYSLDVNAPKLAATLRSVVDDAHRRRG